MSRGLAVLGLGLLACTPSSPDSAGTPTFSVSTGTYEAYTPSGWDGVSSLPVLVTFHGHNGSPRSFTSRTEFINRVDELGILLVLPAGADGTWDFTNSPGDGVGRDERAFVNEVLDDVEQRWPVDRQHIVALGQSIGGSMVYEFACYDGARFAAFSPMAGTLWYPLPDACSADAPMLRHLHGLNDTTFPMAGRSFGGDIGQGDTHAVLEIMREQYGCSGTPVESTTELASCERWEGCGGGKSLELCVHPGGHPPPTGWVEHSMPWIAEQLGL